MLVLPLVPDRFGRAPHLRVLPVLLAVGMSLAGPGWADDEATGAATLFSGQWSAAAYSANASGTFCWVEGADGSLRVEVLRHDRPVADAPVDLRPLLDRKGRGWTLVVGPDLTGTLNAWEREWRRVPSGLAQLVRVVTAVLPAYPERPARFPFAARVGNGRHVRGIPRPRQMGPTGARDEVWRYQLAPLTLGDAPPPAEPRFRQRMTARGRGTGAAAEVLVLKWVRASAGAGPAASLSSSRRPGTLHLAPAQTSSVTAPEPEVFLPLWPLSQFFSTP
jgi:hypothetical protein